MQVNKIDNRVAVGQRWKHRKWFNQPEVRIMGIVEGYVVVRYFKKMPFLELTKDFVRDYRLVSDERKPCKSE